MSTLLRGRGSGDLHQALEDLIDEAPVSELTAAGHERLLISNILALRDMTADDVMTPRVDIVGVNVKTGHQDQKLLLAGFDV
ncbi:MAG: magnesium/cobalt efflux protein, partial [Pseudomonadota bacterium]|nr:magnesium/cobalt efflux protein [Pseudomonadota bacterium]